MNMTEPRKKDTDEYLTARDITVHYGDFRALDGVSMSAAAGEFVTLLGPSGSGKSTLLYAIGGLVRLQQGVITIGGKVVTHTPIQERSIGFVFQNYALFPHLTVAGNIAFALKARHVPARECERRVHELLELVSLSEFSDRTPSDLSGGQQQRVALARALAHRPDVLLLDEPMGALDYQLRRELGRELKAIQKQIGTTAIYVTHDPIEALLLSDKVIALHDGRIEQVGTPEFIYRRPRTVFVAQLLGEANRLQGIVRDGSGQDTVVEVLGKAVQGYAHVPLKAGEATIVMVRPENLFATRENSEAVPEPRFQSLTKGRILDHFFLGDQERVSIALSDGSKVLADCAAEDAMRTRIGQQANLYYRSGSATVFERRDAR